MKLVLRTAIVVFLLDQVSKYLVVQVMDLKTRGAIDVWPPYLNLRMAWNRGVNFGLFSDDAELMRWLLIGVALLVTAWVLYWVRSAELGRLAQLSAGLLVGGALGNVVDRVIHGAVADFLNMSCCGIQNPYAFNVADIGVFIGAVGLILFSGQSKTP